MSWIAVFVEDLIYAAAYKAGRDFIIGVRICASLSVWEAIEALPHHYPRRGDR